MKINNQPSRIRNRSESGMTLTETIVALAIIGTIAVVFLSGLITTSNATVIADEQATAESLARSQMEWVQETTYVENATQYTTAPILSISDYQDYSANISAMTLHTPDDGIQKITVRIYRNGGNIITLEGYKRR
jgi:prepilin-type N-terminal cleavage/methylation domain-containing protein